MKTTTLLIEFLVIGFLSGITIFLFYAVFYTVNFDATWRILDESKGYGAVVITVIFYALGAVFHRFIEILSGHCFNREDKTDEKARMVNVLQNGSESINNRFIYELSLMRIFASLSLLLPIIGIMYCVLDYKTQGIGSGAFVLLLSLVIALASIVCYKAQRNSIKSFIDTFANMKKIE